MLACIVTCGGLCPGLNTVIREIVHSLDYMYGVTKVLGIDVSWLFMNIIVSLESLCLDFPSYISNFDTWSRPVRLSPERVFLQIPNQYVKLICQAYVITSLFLYEGYIIFQFMRCKNSVIFTSHAGFRKCRSIIEVSLMRLINYASIISQW